MKTYKKFLSFLLVFSIIFVTSPVYAAKSVNDLKKEMEERNKEIKKVEKEINSKKSEKNSAIQKRNSLDLQISALLDDIESVQLAIDEKEEEINQKNKVITELNTQIDKNNNVLKNRLKVMYEYGTTSYVQLLLESKSLADLVTRLSVIKSVYNYDKNIINEFISTKKQVEEAKEIIVTEQNEQIEARKILENKKSNLNNLRKEKDAIINELNADIKALEKEEAQKEADYNAIQRELNAALNGTGKSSNVQYSGNGKFQWPSAASTRITSSYGYRIHPISGVKKLHRGIDIGAGMGTNVLAAEAGVVVTAGWNNSYGYYITINHGSGYVTLYAHNSKLLVSKGDKVSRGQVIAKCGSTGNSTGPHIHFEVQKNGSLQNPMNFF